MRVVSDTSPLSNLAIIGRLGFLNLRYGEILIPKAVEAELNSLTHLEGRKILDQARHADWLKVVRDPVHSLPSNDRSALDLGEAAAIELAMEISADLLLIDERIGRRVARYNGLPVCGVLGELLHAKQRQWITTVRPEIDRLRAEARFFVSPEIEKLILKEAGE